MSENESYTHQYKETKMVKKWINSSELRRQWWRRSCPICGSTSLRFKLAGVEDNEVKKVSCFECDWEIE
tara:strand:- start:964 stop:1170 length:207 start_codon:yes stop_codon:yes gene_type:complete